MAKRYSGNLQISVTYDDHNFYRTAVSRGGKLLWRGIVKPAPAGFGPGVAYDSPRAYDEVASSALAFADDEVGGIGDEADFKEDMTGYLIRRSRPGLGKGSSAHATIHHGGIKRDVANDWKRRSREAAARGEPVVWPPVSKQRATSEQPKVRASLVGGRWQVVDTLGNVIRGNVYNADGRGYGTRQGAVEAVEMFRKLGKQA